MQAWTAVDAIVAMDPGRSARGIRNIPATLNVFETHFSRFPVLPGVLVLGSLVELASRLLNETTGDEWRLGGARRIRFKRYVRPGDRLDLSVSIDVLEPPNAQLRGTVMVADEVVVTAAALIMVVGPAL